MSRVPADGDDIRPEADAVTITYSSTAGSQKLEAATIWQSATATTSFLMTGGELEVNQLYLAKKKSNESTVNFTITAGRLFVNRNVNMTWSNSGDIDSRFRQAGGSVRIGDGTFDSLFLCVKNSGQVATYDLEGGDFEAMNVELGQAGQGGSEQTAVFNQKASTTAIINRRLQLGAVAGTTGAAIYNLDGGELTIKAATDPIVFSQPGAPVYFDFDGGALNLKGSWDFASLSAIPNADFRVAGVTASVTDLVFTSILIDAEPYTRIATFPRLPSAANLAIHYDAATERLTFLWAEAEGVSYRLLSDTTLDRNPSTWSVFAADVESGFSAPKPTARSTFFVLDVLASPQTNSAP